MAASAAFQIKDPYLQERDVLFLKHLLLTGIIVILTLTLELARGTAGGHKITNKAERQAKCHR
jgi:hypothetical protein